MLVPNTDIWQTRIQNIDALLTVRSARGSEVYYLATVCQVSLDPPLLSISPNPEYPICAAIEAGGRFAINFLSADQGELIARCIALDRQQPDKIAALGLTCASSEHGTPLMHDCLQCLECQVERAWDSGDHRTYIATVVQSHARAERGNRQPHRFGGGQRGWRRLAKTVLCRTGLVNIVEATRGWLKPAISVEEGTKAMLDPASPPSAPVRAVRAPAPPGVCLVGCGWWGKVHALAMKGMGPRLQRFFASRDPVRAREFAGRFDGADAFAGFEAALADNRVHAVILALPHDAHFPLARAALAAGKHVLVEKPLALSVAEGEELVRLAESSGLCLAVAEQYRLSPLIRKAGGLIDAGTLGKVTMARASAVSVYHPEQDWKKDKASSGGGMWLDVGIHYVNILRHWFGEPELAWAAAPTATQMAEDSIIGLLRFRSGLLANLQISWSAFASPDTPNLEIMGELGTVRIWFSRPYLEWTTPLGPRHWSVRLTRRLPWRVVSRLGGWLPSARRRRLRVPKHDLIGSQALIEDFVRAITTGCEPCVSGREGLQDLRVVMAAYAHSAAVQIL